jgi:hypothetical protein
MAPLEVALALHSREPRCPRAGAFFLLPVDGLRCNLMAFQPVPETPML